MKAFLRLLAMGFGLLALFFAAVELPLTLIVGFAAFGVILALCAIN